MADFIALAKRTLDEEEHKIFRFHYLLGANWRICCERMKLDKGDFFHTVYRIEQKIGRALRETRPYPLYPIDEYYFGVKVEHKAKVLPMTFGEPVKPPVSGQEKQEAEPEEIWWEDPRRRKVA